ncbi:MAG: HAD family hydrolase [Thermoleophilia bacterium]
MRGLDGLRAVLFDVDFTLCQPGPQLGPEGYRAAAARVGLVLDPARYDEARLAAVKDIRHHPELEHDDEVWIRFTEDIVRGMGGSGPGARAVAESIVLAWESHENFELYDDALPAVAAVKAAGLKVALVSNAARDLDVFAAHHALDADAVVTSRWHGKVKPHPTIFLAALSLLDVDPADALMVGDSPADDVEGARSVGMHAVLLDREGLYPGRPDRVPSLAALVELLGLAPA